ncbi:hypothetical protein CAEBREN_13085 [Caenorhabditis brenneri]|uniref:Uncharacterized protein n=1 Tax=Caenorhabditis brenneri TaxID=135651 RepID=G0P0D3_CAEBE|nr:hypothetical protein CAEBREN_13085 [Caenorhabditis brenneri]
MSINKDHQKPEVVLNSVENNHSHQLSDEQNDLKDEVQRLQAEATSSDAKLSEAHAKIESLKTQLKETISLTAQAQRVHAASQALQESLVREKAAFTDQLKRQDAHYQAQYDQFVAEWRAMDKKNIEGELRVRLSNELAARQIKFGDLETSVLQRMAIGLNQMDNSQKVLSTAGVSFSSKKKSVEQEAQAAEVKPPKKKRQVSKEETQTAKKRTTD